ncbi:MAG TPA: hypothetical protein VFV14_03875, partial [Myxococcaceae bacterium]|nr:hypothetical protein [Myxococcaceae bacterium]
MGQAGRKQRRASTPTADTAVPESAGSPPAENRWEKPSGMGRVGWTVLASAILLINLPLLHRLLRPAPPATVALPYEDDFSSAATIPAHYFSTGGYWRTHSGELFSPGVKNNPLWLKAKLPQNVVIDFDARSSSPEGDIRIEVFGNGVDHLSGYELIQGGWNNTVSAIVRLDENSRTMSQLLADAQRVANSQGMRSVGLAET